MVVATFFDGFQLPFELIQLQVIHWLHANGAWTCRMQILKMMIKGGSNRRDYRVGKWRKILQKQRLT